MHRPSGPFRTVLPLLVGACAVCNPGISRGEWHSARTDDGVTIHYETVGRGVPIFLIAGGPGGDSSRFRYTHTLLEPLGQLVFLDNRGRGRSVVDGRPEEHADLYSLDGDLKDVEAVRKAIGAERIIIYGQSYGSMVAMAYAARFPEHTLALCTSAGIHGARVWQERNIDGVKRFLRNHYPRRWKRIKELHDAGMLTGRGELALLFDGIDELYDYNPESEQRLAAQLDDYNDPKAARFNLEVYLTMVGDDPEWVIGGKLKNVELLPELSNYKGPALIMGGRFDRICPPINQVEIAGALENSRLVIFERSGHSPFTEEPLRFLAVFSQFLRDVISTPDAARSPGSGNGKRTPESASR